ncbi:MAG: MFS transporter [Thermoplasmata archaeon]|nr:MFS transporter [Thermoplasmata archaeon]
MDIQTRPTLRPSTSDLWFLSYLPLAVSDGVATPLIPLLALQHFGASAFAVTIIIAASAMSQVPFTIVWGNLSDRVAHRKFFLVGSFLATGVSLILIAFAKDLPTFFWLNVVEGLASAASAPIGTMLLLETRHKRWWPQDIGLFGLISGVGTTAGLGLGFVWLFVLQITPSVIQVMTALLVVAGVLALLSAYLAYSWIEEPAVRLERRSLADLLNLHRGVVERIRHMRNRVLNVIDLTRPSSGRLPRREILFLLALGVMTVGFDVFYGPFPVFLNRSLQLGDADIFIVYLAASFTSTLLFFHSGKVVEWASPKLVFLESLGGRVLLLGLFLWAPAYYALGLGTPHLVIWVTLLNGLMGVTWAFISTASTLFLVRVVGRSKRGQALGLYNAVAGAGGLFGTLLGGFLFATYGFSAAYTVAAVTVLAGAVLLLPIPFHVFFAPQANHRRSPLKGARATSPPRFPVRPPPRDLSPVLDGHHR